MSEAEAHFERVDAVSLIGLPVVTEDGESVGVVTDANATEQGQITGLQVKVGWLGGDRCISRQDFTLRADVVVTGRPRSELSNCPEPEEGFGLHGVLVRSPEGELQGKIANVLVEPLSLNIVGLELSNGLVRDWVSGRPFVILNPEDDLGTLSGRFITLPEDTRTVQPSRTEDETDKPSGAPPIDWEEVGRLPLETIRDRMAQVVWERRGSPKEGPGGMDWKAYVTPWAEQLKKAASGGDRAVFDDTALLSGDQVEAIRIFRKGTEPLERGAASVAPETGKAMAA